jgi:nicotinamidase-related amidase
MTEPISNIEAGTSALLVMDYQTGILSMLPDSTRPLSRATEAIAIARRRGAHVGYVRVAVEDDELSAIPPRNKMFARLAAMGRSFGSDSPATQIPEAIAPQPQDVVVRKIRVGAFSTTNLESELRARAITTLILAGISTSGVVLSTVRDAADRDYRLIVLADACEDPEPAVHEFLLEKILPRQADVISVAELEALFM